MRRYLSAFAAVSTLGVSSSCAPPQGNKPAFVIDTTAAGVRRVTNTTAAQPEQWRVEEDFRIGEIEGNGPTVFGQIRSFGVDSDANLYVLDFMSQEIRVFDPAGRFVRSFGGEGGGPGEFQGANGLAWGPDETLWVSDPRSNRVSVFNRRGEFLASYPRDVSSFGFTWEGGVSKAGVIYHQAPHFEGVGRDPGVETNTSRVYLKTYDTRDGAVDSVFVRTQQNRFYRIPRGAAAIPFIGEWITYFDLNGWLWLGHTREYELLKTTWSGDTVLALVRAFNPVPVQTEERDRRLRELVERADNLTLDYSVIPETKPAIEQLFTDDRERLWVRPVTATTETLFEVFSQEGVLEAVATLDFAPVSGLLLLPRVRAGSFYAVVEDDLDVQYIVRGKIVQTQ